LTRSLPSSDSPSRTSRGVRNSSCAPTEQPTARRSRRRVIVLALIGILAIAAHLVLGGAVLAAPPWAGWAATGVLAVVLVKAALIGLG
jgi:fatty acid desaturase